MTDPKGFLRIPRQTPAYRPVEVRLMDSKDVVNEHAFSQQDTRDQATRCMNCGVPFCHNGCPLNNLIPEFNEAVHQGDWGLAYDVLQQTNNFPEFTGRICPAPCEHACVLNINQPSVAIEHIERTIAEVAFERGYVRPNPPRYRTGKRAAVIGSGPAGLAAAAQLNKKGHSVTVYEKDHLPGGLLRYGIPDFKLEKWVISRRVAVMEAEGIVFKCGVNIGWDISGEELLEQYDAVVVCTGAPSPRDLPIPGREFKGIHYAMDYLVQQNKRIEGRSISDTEAIWAEGKHVVVIGGGDTGSDCVGTANRQGALSVSQFQYHLKPGETRPEETPWPHVPMMLYTSSSHEEGCQREWAIQTKSFVDDGKGNVKALKIVELKWDKDPVSGKNTFVEVQGSEREIPCDLALIAIGYKGAPSGPIWEQLGLTLNERGLIQVENCQTSQPKLFVAGDVRRGQSLVVWAIAEGRKAAEEVNKFLLKS